MKLQTLATTLTLLAASLVPQAVQAQVFDSGPSPSSSFAIVINLPGDEMVITGDEDESVGGSGETTQLNVSAGMVGRSFFAGFNSEVNISGGSVEDLFTAFSGSEVNISGGTLGNFFDAFSGSQVNISGGTVGDFFDAFSGSQVNISGGTVGDFFDANSGSEVNISGGTVGDFFDANSGSEVNILGSAFSINGEPLNMLQAGQPFTITGRDVTLSGVLADGEPFSFDLNSTPYSDQDFFSPDATLTVTLFLLADVNLDGSVNFFDISPFIELLLSNQFQNEADIDRNGVVNFFDISPFIEILSGA